MTAQSPFFSSRHSGPSARALGEERVHAVEVGPEVGASRSGVVMRDGTYRVSHGRSPPGRARGAEQPTPMPTPAPPSPRSLAESVMRSWLAMPPTRSAASAPRRREEPPAVDARAAQPAPQQQPADERVPVAHRAQQQARGRAAVLGRRPRACSRPRATTRNDTPDAIRSAPTTTASRFIRRPVPNAICAASRARLSLCHNLARRRSSTCAREGDIHGWTQRWWRSRSTSGRWGPSGAWLDAGPKREGPSAADYERATRSPA